MRIRDFAPFFALASSPDSRQSTDPVTQLWDLFALGIPLCYIFNLLEPPVTPIAIDTNPHEFDLANERGQKRAIALFAMQIRQVAQCEPFTVTDLWDRNSTDGLVKVRPIHYLIFCQVACLMSLTDLGDQHRDNNSRQTA